MHSNVRERYNNIDFEQMFKAGFKPIAYSVMMLEDTFYFKTKEESIKAYEYFESGDFATREYIGWWHSIDEVEANNKYCSEEMDNIPELIYL